MNLPRLLRHLFAAPWAVQRHFPAIVLSTIETAVARTERQHGGELRWAIEGSLDGPALWRDSTPRERAMEVFALLRMWDTEANNGVLIYVLLADHAVEIVADRGFGDVSTHPGWLAACKAIEQHFAKGEYERGAVEGIESVGWLIATHYPAIDRDELPNSTVLL